MPQLDILGFTNQLITLIITMGVLYYMMNKYFIPTIGSIAIVREMKTIAGERKKRNIIKNTENLEMKINKKMTKREIKIGKEKKLEEMIINTISTKITNV